MGDIIGVAPPLDARAPQKRRVYSEGLTKA
jgi:hypothetical protein